MRAPSRAMACALASARIVLPEPSHAADRRPGLVGEHVEDPLLVVDQAPQALLLILDLAPDDRDQLVLRVQCRADGLHTPVGQRAVVGPAEAAKDPANRIVDFPQPGRIQDQFALDARRQRSFEPAVGKRHSETVGKRQVVAGTTKLVFHQLDDVVHAALRLRERVLVEQAVFTADVADPLPAVEQERTALDLDEKQSALGIQQHEVALALP